MPPPSSPPSPSQSSSPSQAPPKPAKPSPSRILVAVDGSACAKKALDAALEMAREMGATVYILMVVEKLPLVAARRDMMASVEALMEKDARVLLADYATLAERRGVKAETIVAKGHPANIILYTAKAKGADMIVVGRRGLGGFRGLLMGSVSSAVLQNSKVPVLVIK